MEPSLLGLVTGFTHAVIVTGALPVGSASGKTLLVHVR